LLLNICWKYVLLEKFCLLIRCILPTLKESFGIFDRSDICPSLLPTFAFKKRKKYYFQKKGNIYCFHNRWKTINQGWYCQIYRMALKTANMPVICCVVVYPATVGITSEYASPLELVHHFINSSNLDTRI